MDNLVSRLRDEADLCRSETANDVADLLEEAANALAPTASDAETARAIVTKWYTSDDTLDFKLHQMAALDVLIAQALAASYHAGAAAQRAQDAVYVETVKRYYPTSVFTEPPPGEHGATVDACSARAARHVCDTIARELRASAPTDAPTGETK